MGLGKIHRVGERLATFDQVQELRGPDVRTFVQKTAKFLGYPVPRGRSKTVALIHPKNPALGSAKAGRFFQYRFEHRGEVARRRIDDLQYLGGRGLLL